MFNGIMMVMMMYTLDFAMPQREGSVMGGVTVLQVLAMCLSLAP
jgi:hypothetical protein